MKCVICKIIIVQLPFWLCDSLEGFFLWGWILLNFGKVMKAEITKRKFQNLFHSIEKWIFSLSKLLSLPGGSKDSSQTVRWLHPFYEYLYWFLGHWWFDFEWFHAYFNYQSSLWRSFFKEVIIFKIPRNQFPDTILIDSFFLSNLSEIMQQFNLHILKTDWQKKEMLRWFSTQVHEKIWKV